MKHSIIIASAVLAALLCQSCAKKPDIGKNEANKRYLESWIRIYHPEAKEDGNGIYILDEAAGSGRAIGDAQKYPYASISYTKRDLDGNIVETTFADVAQQIGTYDPSYYYGPKFVLRRQNSLSAGLEKLLNEMNVGDTKTAVIPGWYDTVQYRFEKDSDYFDLITGNDYIYTLTLHDSFENLEDIQIDSIENYIRRNLNVPADSVKVGYYYIQTQAPTDTTTIEKSGTVYVNYTGRLLNGTIFDTTDENTAKDAGLYMRGKAYEPYGVTLEEDFREMDTVQGFSYCVSNMKKGEKGICIFYSNFGYGSSDQSTIPSFSPLRFDIEMIGTTKK